MVPDEVIKEEKKDIESKKLGRNQLIAIFGYGLPLLMTYALVWINKITGPEWISFIQVFLPIGIGTILGTSAIVKSIGVIASKKS